MLCSTPARSMEYVIARDQGNSLTRSHRRRPDVLTSLEMPSDGQNVHPMHEYLSLADLSPELQISALQTLGCPVIPIIPDAQQLGTLKALIHAWACIYLLKIILKSALQGSENGLKRTGN